MEARKPISLIKAKDIQAHTWPDEPDRFTEDHVDKLLLWCVKQNSSDVTIQSDRPVYNEIHGALYPANVTMLYTLGIGLHGAVLAQLLHWGMGFSCLIFIAVFCRRYFLCSFFVLFSPWHRLT